MHAKDKAAPAPSKAKAKAKPKAEPKAQGKVCYYQGLGYVPPIPLRNCFKALSDAARQVRFSKHAERQSVKQCKNPTYLKWGIYDKDYVKQWTDAEGNVIFSTQDEIEQYEEHARREAILKTKSHNISFKKVLELQAARLCALRRLRNKNL